MTWCLVIFSALTSLWTGALTIRVARRFKYGVDESSGVQKFHSHWVPRLGGVPIFTAIFSSLLLAAWLTNQHLTLKVELIVCMLPAFGIGLIEDVTRKAGVLSRLLMAMVSAGLGWWLLGAGLHHLDLPFVDPLLAAFPVFALALTLVAAAGVAHAVNIIDGYNGLSGFFIVVVLISLALIADSVGDAFILRVSLLSVAAVAGFLVWNFPFGRIFMGDAGAYMLGFLVAELSMLLVTHHPQVSPWCPLLLMIYPVWETLFSMYRRSARGFSRMGQPDARHLHQLIYRRLMKRYGSSRDPHHRLMRNSFTSMYLWALATMCAVPAVLFYKNTGVLMLFTLLFVLSYLLLYRKLISFRAPRFMVVRSKLKLRADANPAVLHTQDAVPDSASENAVK
ncbi:MAG: MraY family glycosyltransferase [Stenotrophobium sp.]